MGRQRRRAPAICTVLISAFALAACERAPGPDQAKGAKERFDRIEKEVKVLSDKLDLANEQIAQLRGNLADLEFQMGLVSSRYKSTVLDPGERGFSRLDTSVGSFAIPIQDVAAHADGVRVRLHVGNLTTATVNGGTFQAKWGPRQPSLRDKDFSRKYTEWSKSLRDKRIDFLEDLKSGAWNDVTLTLPGLPPAQFGHLELSMETNKISLLRSR